jgi:hypothetical protein
LELAPEKNAKVVLLSPARASFEQYKSFEHHPHFSQKVRSRTPEALQNLGFDGLLALEQKRQCVVRIQLKIIIN